MNKYIDQVQAALDANTNIPTQAIADVFKFIAEALKSGKYGSKGKIRSDKDYVVIDLPILKTGFWTELTEDNEGYYRRGKSTAQVVFERRNNMWEIDGSTFAAHVEFIGGVGLERNEKNKFNDIVNNNYILEDARDLAAVLDKLIDQIVKGCQTVLDRIEVEMNHSYDADDFDDPEDIADYDYRRDGVITEIYSSFPNPAKLKI